MSIKRKLVETTGKKTIPKLIEKGLEYQTEPHIRSRLMEKVKSMREADSEVRNNLLLLHIYDDDQTVGEYIIGWEGDKIAYLPDCHDPPTVVVFMSEDVFLDIVVDQKYTPYAAFCWDLIAFESEDPNGIVHLTRLTGVLEAINEAMHAKGWSS